MVDRKKRGRKKRGRSQYCSARDLLANELSFWETEFSPLARHLRTLGSSRVICQNDTMDGIACRKIRHIQQPPQ